MRAVILNGSKTEDDTLDLLSDIIVALVERSGYEVDNITLRDQKIASCTGCFGCWLRTPGTCVIDDDGRKVAEKAIRSNLLVYLTPVTFGGYSSELKKAVDRIACSKLLPFLTKIGGEVHHPSRYEKTPTLVVLGVLPSRERESEELFETLVARNAINMHTRAHSGIAYSTDTFDVIQKKVDSLLDRAGVGQ
jgi:multimeric flavodoxin WrbA